MSYQEAEYLLAKRTRVGHSAWHKFKKSVLRELCWALNLPVAASGRNGRSIRKDYVEAIINFVRTWLVRLYQVKLIWKRARERDVQRDGPVLGLRKTHGQTQVTQRQCWIGKMVAIWYILSGWATNRATPEVWSSQVETCQDWHFTDFLTRMLFTSDYIDLGVQTWRRAVIFAIVLQILIFIIKHLLKDFGLWIG